MKAESRNKALEEKLSLAAEEMPPEVRERLRHRIVSQLDRAGFRPVAQRRMAIVQMAAMLVVAMTLLGGTAYAISRSQPGDILYPVKESVAGVGRFLPSDGRLPEEPVQRKLVPESDPRQTEEKEEPRDTEKRYEAEDALEAPGKGEHEKTGPCTDKGQDADEREAADRDPGETEPGSGRGRESGEMDEAECSEALWETPRGSQRENRGFRNGSRGGVTKRPGHSSVQRS